MEKQISNFIRALRSADVRVSTGEALDAARTVAMIGYDDRALMKDSLACVLAKSESEKSIHDRLFDLYFSSAPAGAPAQSASAAEETAGQEDPKDAAERLSQLTQQGNEQALATAVERAAEQAGLNDIR
ncbi:MAG: hypothetical protein Q8S09_13915, partial [Hyphomonas sp.]|nr:hypothetical protein [Hyphomonas sp.]